MQTNPINTLKNKLNYKLKKLKENKKLDEDTYKNLYSNKAVTPRFYANIKTHKENNPIRPIVSFIDSPTYELAKFLSKLLTPITDKATQKLKNSYQAKEVLETINVPEDNILVSYDVKSLFTCIPQDFALTCITEAIE